MNRTFLIKLNDSHYHYLVDAPFLTPECQELIRKGVKKTDHWVLMLTDDQADAIREQLQDHFLYCGLDNNFELTQEGKQLDQLIDDFFLG